MTVDTTKTVLGIKGSKHLPRILYDNNDNDMCLLSWCYNISDICLL